MKAEEAEEAESLLMRFDAPEGNLSLMLEDNGNVAYAYLLENEKIVGDVWLYNVAEAPAEVKWKQSAMPFVNPTNFCHEGYLLRINEDSDVECKWFTRGVELSVDGVLTARLEVGAKPGWSRLAVKSGPLSKPLNEARREDD